MISSMHRASNPWKGRLIWLIVLLTGLGGGAMYFYLHPEELPEWAARSGLGRNLQTTTVYKWQDASGEWHISDRKPAGNIDFQEGQYARDTNILPLPPELQR